MAYRTAWFGATSGFLALALGIATVLQNGGDTGVRRTYLSIDEGDFRAMGWKSFRSDYLHFIKRNLVILT